MERGGVKFGCNVDDGAVAVLADIVPEEGTPDTNDGSDDLGILLELLLLLLRLPLLLLSLSSSSSSLL